MTKRKKKNLKAGRFYIYEMEPCNLYPKGYYEIKDEAYNEVRWIGESIEIAKEVLSDLSRATKYDNNPRVQIYEMENGSREIPNKKLKKMAIKAYKNNLEVIKKLDEWGLL